MGRNRGKAGPTRRRVTGWGLAATLVGTVALTATGATGGSANAADPAFFAESTVWATGSGSVATHRIPSIVTSAEGTVLVASEARITNGDADPHHIVVKRSTDGGATWGSDITIEQSIDGQAWANPTPLVDEDTGRLFLFYALNHDNVSSQVFYRSSDDDGVTWSGRVEVTSLFADGANGWTMHLPGPGHGIQLQDGRLVLEVWHRKSVTFPAAQRAYGATVIFSDDGGTTWEAGGGPALESAYPIGEAGVEQRADGSLLMIGRYQISGDHSRVAAVSPDGGETWSSAYLAAGIPVATTVQAGYARYTVPGDDVSRLLFSRPDSSSREDLTLSISYDEGETFPVGRLVHDGPAAYSDITTLPDGTILVAYETGPAIIVARMNLEWLSGGTDSLDDGPQQSTVVLEAEELVTSATDPLVTVTDPVLSGGAYIDLDASGAGDYVDLTFSAPAAGTYDLGVHYLSRSDRGTFQASLDGVALGGSVNAYTSIRKYPVVDLGSVTLGAGTHVLRLAITGKAAASSDFRIGVDYLSLTS